MTVIALVTEISNEETEIWILAIQRFEMMGTELMEMDEVVHE